MRKSFFDRKIPSLLGITVIVIGIIATTFLVKGRDLFQINAGPGSTPKNIQITNISDTSFTLSYMTDASAIGTISFGKDPNTLDQTVLDDRDQLSQTVNNYQAHSITVNSLEPNTTYYFTLTSASESVSDNGAPFKVITGPTIINPPGSQTPITGKVINPDGTSPSDGLVTVTINGAQKLSTILKNDGSYTLPLNNVRKEDLSDYFQLSQDSIINIQVNSANLASFISVSPDQTSPVPVITLSNNYDFSEEEPISSNSANLENQKFPEINSNIKKQEVDILTPDRGEKFTDDQPRFDGTAAPNAEVQIEIHSDENIKTEVKADANGKWSFRPSAPLSVGEHTITIITKDAKGIVKTVTEKFTIFAAGTQVAESATPSATVSPTKTPSKTPTRSPTKAPTKSPSPTAKPSITLAPTNNVTPTQAPPISVFPTLPPTGTPFAIIAGIGLLTTAVTGIVLFLLTHRNNSL